MISDRMCGGCCIAYISLQSRGEKVSVTNFSEMFGKYNSPKGVGRRREENKPGNFILSRCVLLNSLCCNLISFRILCMHIRLNREKPSI